MAAVKLDGRDLAVDVDSTAVSPIGAASAESRSLDELRYALSLIADSPDAAHDRGLVAAVAGASAAGGTVDGSRSTQMGSKPPGSWRTTMANLRQ